MYCRKCKLKMTEQKRSFHKKRKWVCPKCKAVKMQTLKERDKASKASG